MIKFSYRIILLIIVSIFLISVIILDKTEQSFKNDYDQYTQYNKLGSRYISLKSSWLYKKNVDIQIKNILKSCNITTVTIKKSSKVLRVEFKTTLKQLDKFINKVLNTNFIIKQLVIDKNSLLLIVEC